MGYTLGIDSGSTVTKAAVFDDRGNMVASSSQRVATLTPRARWVERDIDEMLAATAAAVRACTTDIDAGQIDAVGVTGHGDGLYLMDADGAAVRPAVLSLDSRACDIVDRWAADGTAERIFAVTGQPVFPATPAVLMAWFAENDPEALRRTRWALSCKDTIKLWLTGAATTDPTEASVSFTDLNTQRYSDAAFEAYGLAELADRLAPVVGSLEVAGEVTAVAARATGLRPGTPVVSGMHDVDACAIASGCISPGQLSIVAGTYSINQVISDRAHGDTRWHARNFVTPGMWMNMAISPASATNLEWFSSELGAAEASIAAERSGSVFDVFGDEVAEVAEADDNPIYLPFLFGSPLGSAPSAGWLGIRGWHRREHLVRAVYEGVVFNHRVHVGDLETTFTIEGVRLAGGAARSAVWAQMFADGLGQPIEVVDTVETGAHGVALAAAIAVGGFATLGDAVAGAVRVARRFDPTSSGQRRMDANYARYRAAIDHLAGFWTADETAVSSTA